MKNYNVTLMATSYKTIVICADSENTALKLARDMYFHTDVLDFDDTDIDEISVQADEIEDDDVPAKQVAF